MKKKILCLMPGTAGGSQRMMLALTKQLDSEKFDVSIVVVHKEITTLRDYVPKSFNLIHIPVRNIWDFAITKMILLIKKEKPDFLFSSIFYLNIRVLIAGKLTGIPVVLRNDNYIAVMRKGQKILARYIYKWAKVVIMQQEEMMDEFHNFFNFPKEKMIVIHNPIDKSSIDIRAKEKSPYPNNEDINYLWVARFDYKKGQDILVKAFIKLHKRVPNAHLYLVGRYHDNRTMLNLVKNIIKEADIDQYVHIIGHDNNPYKWIKHCDCFVLPSRLEGLPNALIESMYLGKPVVATTCIPIIGRIVKDGYNGYLVHSEDSDTMAKAMEKALMLKNFTMTYNPSEPEVFTNIFK